MSDPADYAMDPGVHLQGCGLTTSKPVSDVVVGDVLVWNYGYRSEVVAIERTSACYATARLRADEDGKTYTRKLKLSRRVAWSPKETEKRRALR